MREEFELFKKLIFANVKNIDFEKGLSIKLYNDDVYIYLLFVSSEISDPRLSSVLKDKCPGYEAAGLISINYDHDLFVEKLEFKFPKYLYGELSSFLDQFTAKWDAFEAGSILRKQNE